MFSRLDRGRTPPERVDDFAGFMRAEVFPALAALPGYASGWIGVDRSSGKVAVLTTWRTSDARAACDATLASVLRNATRFALVPIEIELFEDVALA